MKRAVLLPLILLLILTSTHLYAQCNRERDSLALVTFFNSTNGQDWQNKTNWAVPGSPVSTWFGVILNAEGCVESLRLPNNRLSGGLPPETGDLTELKILNLTSNNISGNLPPSITNLRKLEELNLTTNFFNGLIPADIGNLNNLKILRLNLNRLSGNIPASIGNLTGLTSLLLNQNLLSGNIPDAIGNLTNLEELVLSQNNLSGILPGSTSNLSKLRILILSQNQLTGNIPSALGNLQSLRSLSLDENRFSGPIPLTLGNLSDLRELYLQNNQLSGNIPQELTKLTELQKLLANNNNLSGNIPAGFGNLQKLISLQLSDNQLEGPIPDDLGNARNLISLILGNNALSGPIPASLGNLSNLDVLQIQNNQLSGELPESLGNLTKLRRWYFFNNFFEGCFPNTMQRFCNTTFSTNVNTNGHNFMDNPSLVHGGDFKRWCAGEGRPVINIQGDSILCESSFIQLTASGGDFFDWTGPDGFKSSQSSFSISQPNINQFGAYTVTVTNTNRCKSIKIINIKPVNIITTGTNAPICEGTSLQLFASGGISYRWFGPGGYYSEEQNPVRPNANAAMSGAYNVEIKTDACLITRTLEVEFVKFGEIISNGPVCEGKQLTLDVTEGHSFLWKGPGGFESALKNPVITNFSEAAAGVYTVTIKAADNCISTLSVDIQVQKKYLPLLDSIPALCNSQEAFQLPSIQDGLQGLWTGLHINGTPGNQWFNPGLAAGNVRLNFEPSDTTGCTGISTINVFVSRIDVMADEQQASFNDSDNNGSVLVNIDSNGGGVILELEGEKSFMSFTGEEKIIEIMDLPSGNYKVMATDQFGCMATDSVSVRYLKSFYYIPNAIIKNASNPDNSIFYLKGENVISYSYEIFNRWGNLIAAKYNAAINDPADGWNIQTRDITPGVYVYLLTIKAVYEEKQLSGSVTVF